MTNEQLEDGKKISRGNQKIGGAIGGLEIFNGFSLSDNNIVGKC